MSKTGGEVIFSSQTSALVIGHGQLKWAVMSIVEYPSVAAFLSTTSSEEYQKIHVHLYAGLEHQLLVQC